MFRMFGVALVLSAACWAQSTPAERGQDLANGRRGAAYTVYKSEEVYWANNVLFELTDAGWAGLNLDRDGLLHRLSWWPRYLTEYAKRTGVGDIAAMENSNNQDGAADTAQGLKGKVTLHLKDDNVKWTQDKAKRFISYAGTLVEFLGDGYGYTPANGVYNVTFIYTPSVKDIAVAYNKADGSFVVKAPSELEPSGWDSKLKTGLMKGGKFRY